MTDTVCYVCKGPLANPGVVTEEEIREFNIVYGDDPRAGPIEEAGKTCSKCQIEYRVWLKENYPEVEEKYKDVQ